MRPVRPAPSAGLLSDDDDIIELPQAPKRARRGHSTSTSARQKRLKTEKFTKQPVSMVVSDSDADVKTTIEMMKGPSDPRPQTGNRQVCEVSSSGYVRSRYGLTSQSSQHDTDSDSDYDTFHAGLDINDPSNVSLPVMYYRFELPSDAQRN